jgi:hypothetical protein
MLENKAGDRLILPETAWFCSILQLLDFVKKRLFRKKNRLISLK